MANKTLECTITDKLIEQRGGNLSCIELADPHLGLVERLAESHVGLMLDDHRPDSPNLAKDVIVSSSETIYPMTLAHVVSELKARQSSSNTVSTTIPSPSTSSSSASCSKSFLTTSSSSSTTSMERSTDFPFSSNDESLTSTTSYETAITEPTCASELSSSMSIHTDLSNPMISVPSADDDATSPDQYRALLTMTLKARKCATNWRKMAAYWEQRARRAEATLSKLADNAVTPSVSDVSDVSIPLEPARVEAVRQLTRARADTASTTCTSPVHQILLDRLHSQSRAKPGIFSSSLEVDAVYTSEIIQRKTAAHKAIGPSNSSVSQTRKQV